MKSWYKYKIARGGMLGVAVLGLSLIAIPGVSTAVASASTSSTLSVPSVPAAGSSMATWQSWASAQQKAMQSVSPLAAEAPTPGCTTTSGTVEPVVSSGADGIPAGIVTDAVVFVGTCASRSSGTATAGIVPLISTYCPGMDQCNDGSVTNGYEGVGTYTYAGNPSYMASAYTYTGSGTYSAHSELGTVSSGCSSGSTVANSSNSTLSTNGWVEVVWGPRTGSNTWSGTGWHYNGSGYVNLGSVCGMW